MVTSKHVLPWLALTPPVKLVTLIVLSSLAVGLNVWRFQLFFGIELIFGSMLAVLTLCLLGGKAALFVGFCAAAATYVLWGHPYAWIIFTIEIVWLTWYWYKKPGFKLVVHDLIFWMALGLPLVALCYGYFLALDPATVSVIWLKQLANGVFNTLVACVILVVLQMSPPVAARFVLPQVRLQHLFFHILMLLTLAAGAIPFLLDARKLETVYQQELQQRMQLAADLISTDLSQHSTLDRFAEPNVNVILQQSATEPMLALLRNQQGTFINLPTTGIDGLDSTMIPSNAGFHLVRPPGNEILVNRWLHSWYTLVTPLDHDNSSSALVIAVPGKSLTAKLKNDSTRQLLWVVVFMLVTIGLNWWLSRRLAKPLYNLAQHANMLITEVTQGKASNLSQQQVAEYNELSTSLAMMQDSLVEKLQHNAELREDLANQIRQRTAELEQSNSQLQAILAAATNFSIIATDLQGVIRYFSPGAEQLLGYTASELVGQHTPALIHLSTEVALRAAELTEQLQRPIEGFATFISNALLKGSETREWHYVTKMDEQVAVSLTVTCMKNNAGEVIGYLGIAKDIRERQRNEKLKNEFISTVSHELRTPLTSIYGALSILASGKLLTLPPKIEHLVHIACKNSERLSALINDLLDIEKLLAGKVHLQSSVLHVQPLLKEGLEATQEYARKFGITLVTELVSEPLYCQLDAQRFTQVLTNLVSNAVKFSKAPADVRIKLSEQNDHIYIDVIDRGIGIPEAFKARIFERFAQSDAANTRTHGGTGLGLAISRELVLQMGGQIGFNSVLGEGTTFWLSFPKYTAAPMAPDTINTCQMTTNEFEDATARKTP